MRGGYLMKKIGLAAFLVVACSSAALADPSKNLIGKNSFDLVACAGVPESDMKFGGGREIMTFAVGDSSSTVQTNGIQMIFGHRSDNSCQAIVQLQSDRVTKISWKKEGGFISSALMCTQVLDGC